MPRIFHSSQLDFQPKEALVPEFDWNSSPRLAELVGSRDFQFDIRSLDPDRFSFPYHFHRNAEELFFIVSGKAMLRTPDDFTEVNKDDLVFFERGPSGAHQLYNHGDAPCVYLDLRSTVGIDVVEYPDSNKVNILPYLEVYEASSRVNYYEGEENVKEKWPADVVNRKS